MGIGMAAVGMIGAGGVDEKKQREVWVGNLAKDEVSNEMLKQLFEGMLRGMDGTPPNPVINVQLGANQMYAFIELASVELATMCIQVFNGIELKGRPMKVGRPTGYVDPAQAAQRQQQAAQFGGGGMTSLAALGITPAPPPPPNSGAGEALLQKPPPPPGEAPKTKICLENLVSEEELKDDEEYEGIKQDIEEECAKSGKVLQLIIPRPGAVGVTAGTVGKAYVAFESGVAASKAIAALNGRPFGPNTVRASLIDDASFPKV